MSRRGSRSECTGDSLRSLRRPYQTWRRDACYDSTKANGMRDKARLQTDCRGSIRSFGGRDELSSVVRLPATTSVRRSRVRRSLVPDWPHGLRPEWPLSELATQSVRMLPRGLEYHSHPPPSASYSCTRDSASPSREFARFNCAENKLESVVSTSR